MVPPQTEVADISLQPTTHLSTPKGWKAESTYSWLTCSRRLTHISGHPSAAGRAQDTESSPVKDDVLPLCHMVSSVWVLRQQCAYGLRSILWTHGCPHEFLQAGTKLSFLLSSPYPLPFLSAAHFLLPFPSLILSTMLSPPGPVNPARRSGECCKIPNGGRGRGPAANTIRIILSPWNVTGGNDYGYDYILYIF